MNISVQSFLIINPRVAAIQPFFRLQQKGLKVLFVTNTTTESKEKLSSKLMACDLEIPPERIFTSLVATSDLVRQRKLRPLLLLEPEAEAEFDGETVHLYSTRSYSHVFKRCEILII